MRSPSPPFRRPVCRVQPLFRGPRNLQACARKYMCTIHVCGAGFQLSLIVEWEADLMRRSVTPHRAPLPCALSVFRTLPPLQDSGEWGLDRGRRSFMSNPLQQGDSFSNSEGGGEGAQPSASLQSPNGVPKGANLRPISTGRFAALDGDAAKAAGEARDMARQLAAVQATLEQTRQVRRLGVL